MRLLDTSYFYYESIMGKKIDDTGTVGELVKPLTMMTDFDFDKQILNISLKDFRNPKLQTVSIDDFTTEMLIYMLKSKYILVSYNSNHNMMDATCIHFPWKLDFSDHYATDGGSMNPGQVIQFNETENNIEVVRDDHNYTNLRHTIYPKFDPMQNQTETKDDNNEFDYKRVSDNIYAEENIDERYRICITVNGNAVVNNGIITGYFAMANDKLKDAMFKDVASTFIDRSHASIFTLDNKYFSIVNIPYEISTGSNWDNNLVENSQTIESYVDSVEARELFSHAVFSNYLEMVQKNDESEILSNLHTNGHRIFTDTEIYMARNELTRVVESTHFSSYKFNGIPSESTAFDNIVQYVAMPDGTLTINSCTGISTKSVKINDRIYTIIRNASTDANYLAWTDDEKMWIALIELPDVINDINADACDEYYIVFTDVGNYTWAYSLDLSKNTIA